jgi:sucrose-6F-phosphate phosphohydrolase
MAARRLLISDLDGTLLGNDAGLERFAAWHEANASEWGLVYATGRTLASVQALIEESALPAPDATITEVGTVISASDAAAWEDWPVPTAHWDPERVREALAGESQLVPQGPLAQSSAKVSYYAGILDIREMLRLGRQLRRAGVRARLLYSAGRYLDILPRDLGKRAAARHLIRTWGIDEAAVVTAGDTGNDRDLLRMGGHGIVVGNASPELRSIRGPRVIHVFRHHADGVLEGLQLLTTAAPPDGARASRRHGRHARLDAAPAGRCRGV